MAVPGRRPRQGCFETAPRRGAARSRDQNRQGAQINTNLKGRLLHSTGGEQPIAITEAVVTDSRIALDWSHGGQQGRLIAKSTDGAHFSGRYGYGRSASNFECELTLYKSAHEDLLCGTWREHASGIEGTLILRLPSRGVVTHPSETSQAGDLPELVEAARDWDSQPAEIADSPAHARNAPVAAVGKVAPLRLAPGTSARMPSPRPAKAASATPQTEAGRPQPTESAATTPIESAAAKAHEPPAATPLSSATVDHLLSITSEQFGQRDRGELERELLGAPVSALFKVAHNALAAEVRGLAARMFADRYGDLSAGAAPKPAARPVETPEMKARKRRSSRHKTNR